MPGLDDTRPLDAVTARLGSAPPVGRRTMLQLSAAAVAAGTPEASAADNVPPMPAPLLRAGNGIAGAETTTGRIAGYQRGGIYTFKGVPYATAARFALPQPAPPWPGVRSTKQYGAVCPQAPRTTWAFDDAAFVFDWDDGHADEDCLNLNIWTPGIADGGKRPVMVWLHGGGFEAGSSHELKAYDGENLSRRGDVVVISLNHRLGVLGFLAVAGADGDAANLGLLDIVAGLRWVRDNAAAFGGDAGRVTLFGQSGGGGKINALMAMPAAKGLFHRAISQSGAFPSYRRMATPEVSAKLADAVLGTLGIAAGEAARLRAIPLPLLLQAGMAARKTYEIPWKPDVIDPSLMWGPTVDGFVLPQAPFAAAAPALSRDVPLLLGTTLNEMSAALYNPWETTLTEDGLRQRATALYGARAKQVIEAFRAAHPGATPAALISIISSAVFRRNALEQAAMKAAQGGAGVWVYLFAWQTPVLDGRPGAFHTADVPFVFDNTDRAETMTGGGAEPRALAAQVAESWVAFARHGDPGAAGLVGWAPFTPAGRETMLIESSSQLRRNLDDAELATFE